MLTETTMQLRRDQQMIRSGRPQRRDDECGQTNWHHGAENAETTDGNPLGLEDLPSPQQPRPWRWFGLFTFVLIALAMLATVFVVTVADDKKTSLLQAEEKRLQESVLGRIKILQTWLEGQLSASKRLTDSYVFRLFITDLTQQQPTLPLPRSLQDQRPYFRQLMVDFARQNGLVRAAVLRNDGATLLSSSGPPLPIANLLQQVEDAEPERDIQLSPIRRISDPDGPFVVDAIIAFPQAQTGSQAAAKPSALLILTLPIGQVLEDVLSSQLAGPDQEEIALLQQRESVIEKIRMTREGIALTIDRPVDTPRPGSAATFGRRNDNAPVYSLGEPMEGVPWTLYHTLDARAVLFPVHDFIKIAASLSLMVAIALTMAFAAVWWRQGRNHHRLLVELYDAHVRKIEHQHQFLQSVTTSIGDWLTVSTPDGELIYANPAFETVIGRSRSSVSGKRWDDFVKEASAAQPMKHDLMNLIDADMFDVVEIDGDQHVVSSRVSDMLTKDGGTEGTVRVVRDHTDLIAERRRRLLSVTQTVNAFVHAIELRDPFLLGHTDRVRTRAIAVGEKLGLSGDELASLALAASLSQIGKIFIPDDILAKPERHDAEEGEIMRDHIVHAVDILKRIDFDLPIIDIVGRMHERLDGSGYPHGLIGEQIGLSARILGVVDVFCARTEPRSYRDRMSAGKALYHLASNGQRYDLKAVAALAEIVDHGQETVDLDTVEGTFVDAAIWQEKHHNHEPIQEPA